MTNFDRIIMTTLGILILVLIVALLLMKVWLSGS